MSNPVPRHGKFRKLRAKAEEVLKQRHEAADSAAPDADNVRLIHELQVHQVELEMQNAELRRVYGQLEKETARRIEAIEELQKQERLLIQQNRLAAMGEMINNIAHQWRQPLNVLGLKIQGLSHLHALLGGISKEFLDKHTRDSMSLIQHMSNTIEDFMGFLKPDKSVSTFSISQVVQQTVSIVECAFKDREIAIDVLIRDHATANGCAGEFSQVILNILQNARDAILKRRIPAGRISIVLSVDAGKAVVSISDNGGGIPPQVIDKIFEPYFSTKGPQGTGIGLYMSKTIIQNMGGRISARNTLDGAEFIIEV